MARSWIMVGAAMAGAVLWTTPLTAQRMPPDKIDVARLGPQVGERVPDFSLKDQDGAIRNLNSILGPKGAMLVFIRSADW